MIRAAYDTGANFGLFMEDDIMFLRDTALLKESLKHVPADADALLFEWIAPWGPKEFHERIKARASGDYWYRFGRTGVLNCGCYALNRKAMAVMLRILEGPADGQTLFDVCDRHWPVLSDESGLNVYVSSPVACIQDEAKHLHAYEAVGAGRELYGA
jgi:GR25 family glycosyltransferase involved in LPS biosynthesis